MTETWWHIESAPKDGTKYLAVNIDGDMAVLNKPDGCAPGEWEKCGRQWYGSAKNFNAVAWMPLPKWDGLP